jgi:hypothetical protein
MTSPSEYTDEQQRALALAALADRRANAPQRIDNASLPAGSPMYYYCHVCGHLTAELPENWYDTPPPELCDPCQELVDRGWPTDSAPGTPPGSSPESSR